MKRVLVEWPDYPEVEVSFSLEVGVRREEYSCVYPEQIPGPLPAVGCAFGTVTRIVEIERDFLKRIKEKALELLSEEGFHEYIHRYAMNVGNKPFRSYIGVEHLPPPLFAEIFLYSGEPEIEEAVPELHTLTKEKILAEVSVRPVLSMEKMKELAQHCGFMLGFDFWNVVHYSNGLFTTFLPTPGIEYVAAYAVIPDVWICDMGIYPKDIWIMHWDYGTLKYEYTEYIITNLETGDETYELYREFFIPPKPAQGNLSLWGHAERVRTPASLPFFIPSAVWKSFIKSFEASRKTTLENEQRERLEYSSRCV